MPNTKNQETNGGPSGASCSYFKGEPCAPESLDFPPPLTSRKADEEPGERRPEPAGESYDPNATFGMPNLNINGSADTDGGDGQSTDTTSTDLGPGAAAVLSDTDDVANPAISGGYRTNALWDYCKVEVGYEERPKPKLAGLPLEYQEQLILTDLIYCLTGMRGDFIEPLERDAQAQGMAKYETRFSINMELDKSLADIVHQILPLASHFMGMQRAIAANEDRGQVMNALNAELTNLTHDFYLLLSEAETELQYKRLTAPKLMYCLQPTMWLMENIFITLVHQQMNNHHGANLLTSLCERIKQLDGDERTRDVLIELVTKASVPYMSMLKLWIQKGVIVDRKKEFLVKVNESINEPDLAEKYSSEYWKKRYTVRTECIPSFLEKQKDIILSTGKYINVIRQCGKRAIPMPEMHLKFDPTNDQHVRVINDAYKFASRSLLDVLIKENDLMGHLQSVKHYLLFNQGDFIIQFMDDCEEELAKHVAQVLPLRLENLLGLALRLSSARHDPYKDNLHCVLFTYDLVTQLSKIKNQQHESDLPDLKAFECIAFTYDVKWPISLVLNNVAIGQYQILFRQLFYCKYVERQLCKVWKEMPLVENSSPQAARLYRFAFTLRQRMMNAVQNLEYYMMIEIIEPNWHTFTEKMKNVESVDMLLALHTDFLDTCLQNSMLTESSPLNRDVIQLCRICLKFCDFIQCAIEQDEFEKQMKELDVEFTKMLISFLKQVKELAGDEVTGRFIILEHRINFNNFYAEQM